MTCVFICFFFSGKPHAWTKASYCVLRVFCLFFLTVKTYVVETASIEFPQHNVFIAKFEKLIPFFE